MDENFHLAFVYGSLKHGYGNNRLLQRHNAAFLGEGATVEQAYRMLSLSAFPGVVREKGYASVCGELWAVDDAGLAALDRLESNGRLYTREQTTVLVDGETYVAWMYILNIEPGSFTRWPRFFGVEQEHVVETVVGTDIFVSWEAPKSDIPV